ncbi:F-box protein-like protein [Tanacetum coccineum]
MADGKKRIEAFKRMADSLTPGPKDNEYYKKQQQTDLNKTRHKDRSGSTSIWGGRAGLPEAETVVVAVNNRIRSAFSCNVKDLYLELVSDNEPYQSEFVLDQFFFINSSVTHMKLDGCVFKPTCTIDWSNLKSLCIVWGNLGENWIENILSGSPLLETLKLQNCEGFLEINISSKIVKNLVFAGYTDNMDWHVPYVVKINVPHILSLTIEEQLKLGKVVLLNVSSLVEAKLDYYYESDELASEDESDEPTSDDESDEPTSEDECDWPTSWKKREEI